MTDPLTAMAAAAAAAHELYGTLVQAGFTPQQALYLVGQMLAAQVTSQAAAPPDAG